MKRDVYANNLDWIVANWDEYVALHRAQDGDPTLLAKWIVENGELATKEARQYVSDRLLGKSLKRGAKRTIAQLAKELGILGLIQDIQKEHHCGEPTARKHFLDRYPDICRNEDTLKTFIRRAKETLTEMRSRVSDTAVLKTENSETYTDDQ